MNAEEENNILKQKIEGLEKHVAELEEHLKKYTNSTRLVENEKCGIKNGNIMKCGVIFQVSKQLIYKKCVIILSMFIQI